MYTTCPDDALTSGLFFAGFWPAFFLVYLHSYTADRVGAEITQRTARYIGDRIVRGGRLKAAIVPGYLQKAKEIIVDVLIDAVHPQQQRISSLQIAAVIIQGLFDVSAVG